MNDPKQKQSSSTLYNFAQDLDSPASKLPSRGSPGAVSNADLPKEQQNTAAALIVVNRQKMRAKSRETATRFALTEAARKKQLHLSKSHRDPQV